MGITTNKTANNSIFVACAVFMIIAGWYASQIIGDMSSFNDWDKPKEVSEMIKGGCFGGVGFLLALGVDLRSVAGPLLAFLPGFPQPPQPPQSAEQQQPKDGNVQ